MSDSHLRSQFEGEGNKTPIRIITESAFPEWVKTTDKITQAWTKKRGFEPKAGALLEIPGKPGKIDSYVFVSRAGFSPANFQSLPARLPADIYTITETAGDVPPDAVALGWEIGAYNFQDYKSEKSTKSSILVMPEAADAAHVRRQADAIYFIQDLINTTAEDIGPKELADVAQALADKFNAKADIKIIKDESEFPLIWHVGKAAKQKPRLIDISWGNPDDPLVTILGKGVTYDTGGLALKTAEGMDTMKKDKGGAVHALALAGMIMDAKLPVNLRVVVPAAENAINERAVRNGDIVRSRSGKTIEVNDTDAEGRLILADAFTYAQQKNRKPSALMVDFATLTGAARRVGEHNVPVIMGNDKALLRQLEDMGEALDDRFQSVALDPRNAGAIKSEIADLQNVSDNDSMPGHVYAAHFLQDFITPLERWVHIDHSAWGSLNGREGAKAQAIRTIYEHIRKNVAPS
jgi:leucyl aminopeptidase